MIRFLALVDPTTSNTQNTDETMRDDATLIVTTTLSSAGLVVLVVAIFIFKRYNWMFLIYYLRRSIQGKDLENFVEDMHILLQYHLMWFV